MKKIINIAWKDLIVTFRDPAALIIMLVTPFALVLAMTAAFGRGGNPGMADIPIMIVNQDEGDMGELLVRIFNSDELADLVAPTTLMDPAEARAAVDADTAAAAVIIPAGLSESVMPTGPAPQNGAGGAAREPSVIEIYTNPARPISSGVAGGIVDRFVSQMTAGSAAGQVTVSQLFISGRIERDQAQSVGRQAGETAAQQALGARLINVTYETAVANDEGGFDFLAYMVPSMAIFFLMFTVTQGGRSILTERDAGTLFRMLSTPTTAVQVLGGKIFGIYLTGVAQMAILIVASALIFSIRWGSATAVILVVLVLVAAATSWGMLIAAFARTSAQANVAGQAIALIFGISAGTFIPRTALPSWLQIASFVSPNAWGLEAFIALTEGGTLADVTGYMLGLLVMTAILFVVSLAAFRRQYK